MNELIEVKVNDNQEPVVSARELYKGLEVTDRFSRWFERMLGYGFEENVDFTSVKSSTVVNNGAIRELDDYVLKIDMAKEICMLQRNAKSKEFRKYFIQIEKDWNSPEKVMARALVMANNQLQIATKKIDELETKIKEDEPLVTFGERILKEGDNILVRDLAKIATDEGYKTGERRLYNKLREWNYICKTSTKPTQYAMEREYFIVETGTINTPYGTKQIFTSRVTPKGQVHIVERLMKELEEVI